jgi:hypothetical protein
MEEKTQKEMYLEYVNRWKRVAPILEAERMERIRNADTKAFIEMTSSVFSAQLPNFPKRLESGLLIQQREFAKIRKKSE